MKRLILLALLTGACTSRSPLGPTTVAPAPVVRAMAYAINVTSFADQSYWTARYPQGVAVAPLEAQARWDYTAAYGGTPNVYAGEQNPPCQTYYGVGIVIAPRAVAGMTSFTAADWPGAHLDAGVTYSWLGAFVYARVPAPGTFTIDPACKGQP